MILHLITVIVIMFESTKARLEKLTLIESNVIIYYISKIFGQAPFTIQQVRNEKQPLFKYTMASLIYSIGVFIGLSFIFCFSLIGSITNQSTLRFPVTSTVGHYMHLFAGILSAFICYMFAFTRIHHMNRYMKSIQSIDIDLHEISENHKLDYGNAFKFQCTMISIGILMFTLIGVYDGLVFGGLYENIGSMIALTYSLPYIVSAVVQAQFISAIHIIYDRYKLINKFLNYIANTNKLLTKRASKIIENRTSESVSPSSNTNDLNYKIKSIQTISTKHLDDLPNNSSNEQMHNRKNFGTPPQVNLNSSELIGAKSWGKVNAEVNNENDEEEQTQSLWDYIKSLLNIGQNKSGDDQQDIPPNLHLKMNELFSLHEKLFDVCEQINDAYGIQIVSYITITFLITLFGFFFEIKVLFWKDAVNSVLNSIALSYVLWSLVTSFIVYTVLTMCKTTREEAHESALIIHVILQNKPSFMLNDEIYYNKMKAFTLQILHRKNIFNFHGLGLFFLDYTFIFSAVSAATSYLIVLLQFDLAPDFDNSIFGKLQNVTENGTELITV